MRKKCYDLCLYTDKKKIPNIFYVINKLKTEVMNHFNISPSGLGFTGTKKVKKYSDKIFASLEEKTGLEDIVIFFGGEEGVNDDWLIYLELDEKCLSLIVSVTFEVELIPTLKEIVSRCLGEIFFTFGFIFLTTHRNLPEYYNHGTIGNDWSEADEEKIWSWSMNYNRSDGQYKPGDLRDVYPYNIISELHLNRDVHGQTLESWIKSDPSHGTLEKISDTHWLWTVEDQHIPHTQEVLSSAHLLVAYWEKY